MYASASLDPFLSALISSSYFSARPACEHAAEQGPSASQKPHHSRYSHTVESLARPYLHGDALLQDAVLVPQLLHLHLRLWLKHQ